MELASLQSRHILVAAVVLFLKKRTSHLHAITLPDPAQDLRSRASRVPAFRTVFEHFIFLCLFVHPLFYYFCTGPQASQVLHSRGVACG